MGIENKVAVVTDTGSSMRPEDKLSRELGLAFIPLHITFFDGEGNLEPVLDTDVTAEEFYRRMATAPKLPQTSGAVYPQALEVYRNLAQRTDSIMSVHLTGVHSAIVDNATLAAREIMGEVPGLSIEVADSRNLSVGTWFMVEAAARLAQEGADLPTIKNGVLEMVPKVQTLFLLSTLENVIKGGRIPPLQGLAASLLRIHPLMGTVDGKLEVIEKVRTMKKARTAMIDKVFDRSDEVVRLAVLHTNAPDLAEEVRDLIAESYTRNEIEIFEAGPVLGVHAGEGGVGITFMTK